MLLYIGLFFGVCLLPAGVYIGGAGFLIFAIFYVPFAIFYEGEVEGCCLKLVCLIFYLPGLAIGGALAAGLVAPILCLMYLWFSFNLIGMVF